MSKIFEIWGSHRGTAEDSSLLGCYEVTDGKPMPTDCSTFILRVDAGTNLKYQVKNLRCNIYRCSKRLMKYVQGKDLSRN
jgi:hypothetical protein